MVGDSMRNFSAATLFFDKLSGKCLFLLDAGPIPSRPRPWPLDELLGKVPPTTGLERNNVIKTTTKANIPGIKRDCTNFFAIRMRRGGTPIHRNMKVSAAASRA